jgi:acyl-CoA thioester hydrolase
LKLQRIGNSSITYDIGLFHIGDDEPAAIGYLVHVYVGAADRLPSSIPVHVRKGVSLLQ